MVWKC